MMQTALETNKEREVNTSTISMIVIALIGGVAVALQAQFVSAMGRTMGTLGSVFVTYVGGALVITACLLVTRGGNLAALQTVPRHFLTAGVLGLVVIGSVGYTVPRLGLAKVLAIFISSQLIFGVLIDHFGLFGALTRPLDFSRGAGMAVIFLGAWLVLR